MKKIFLWSISFVVLSGLTAPVFSMQISSGDAAETLARDGVITKKDVPSNYQLDKPILRQEAIAIIAKASGAVTGDDPTYSCQRIFRDVSEGWVCRSVEIAADSGIVSKGNKKFRPKDKVSYFEAAVMALKSGCVNPNQSLKGNTDAERILERIRETGVDFDIANKNKSITRGEFFQYIANIKSFVGSNPTEVDSTDATCQKGKDYTTDNYAIAIPTGGEKTDEEKITGQTHGTYFDINTYVRIYVREYNIAVKPGEFYNNSKQGFSTWTSYKYIEEKDGPAPTSKIIRFQFTEDPSKTTAEQYTYFMFNGDKALELTFTYDPMYFKRSKALIEKIFASARFKGNAGTLPQTPVTTPITTASTTPQEGDIVFVNYKKNSDSGRISTAGSSIFAIGTTAIAKTIQDTVVTMKIGESRTIKIPASQVYGEKYKEVTFSPKEFEDFKAQIPLGTLQKTTKSALTGLEKTTISKESALAFFGQLTVGQEIREGNVVNKITGVNNDGVDIEVTNPNALFYTKSINIGDTASVEDVSFTVQAINGEEVVLLLKYPYTIVSQSSTEVVVRVKNTHPFAGESLTYTVTLTDIKKKK